MLLRNRRGEVRVVYFAFPKCASEWMRHVYGIPWIHAYHPNDWQRCHPQYCHLPPARLLRSLSLPTCTGHPPMISIVRNTYARLASAWRFGVAHGFGYALAFDSFERFVEAICESAAVARKTIDDGCLDDRRAHAFEQSMLRLGDAWIRSEERRWSRARPLTGLTEPPLDRSGMMAWMYMPVDVYFPVAILDQVRFFVMESGLSDVVRCLSDDYGIVPTKGRDVSEKINAMPPAPAPAPARDDDAPERDPMRLFAVDGALRALVASAYEYEIDRWGFAAEDTVTKTKT